MAKLFDEFVDCVFPRLVGSSTAIDRKRYDEKALGNLDVGEAELRDLVDDIDALLERGLARQQAIESRLAGIVGMMSIAATIVLGGLIALGAGALPGVLASMRAILAIGMLYLTLQVCRASYVAINGLSRQSYLEETPQEMMKGTTGEEMQRLRNRISRGLARLYDNHTHCNRQVDQMAIAQRSLKNFLVGLFLTALLAASSVVLSATNSALHSRAPAGVNSAIRSPRRRSGRSGQPLQRCRAICDPMQPTTDSEL